MKKKQLKKAIYKRKKMVLSGQIEHIFKSYTVEDMLSLHSYHEA